MNTVTFTYKLTPETPSGFSVLCLDWENLVYTEGETINECKKNAIEVTEMFLKDYLKKKLHKEDYPKIKKHLANPLQFQLSYNLQTGKHIDIDKLKSFESLNPVSRVALA